MPATPVPVMLFVLLALILLPFRLNTARLKGLAFLLWFLGGVILAWRGVSFWLSAPQTPDVTLLAMLAAGALIIGWGKGQFVLSKTARRNLDRLDAMTRPMRPIHVYGLRSWIIIGVMVLISLSLTWFGLDVLWRGAINLGIGISLLISSLVYVRAFGKPTKPTDASA